jgi:hypothetical protein
LLSLKAAANAQLFTSDGQRSVEDLEMAVLSFGQMKALATGDPLIMEKVRIESALTKLYLLHDKWYGDHQDAQREYAGIDSRIAYDKQLEQVYQRALEYREKFPEKATWWKVQGKHYTERAEAGRHLESLLTFKLIEKDVLELPYATVSLAKNAFGRIVADIGVGKIVNLRCELNESGSGALTKIDNEINDLARWVTFFQNKQAEGVKRKAYLEALLAQPFEKQAEIQALEKELFSIDEQMAAKAKEAAQEPIAANEESKA